MWVVSLLEGGPISPSETSQALWAKTQPPGAVLQAPTPCLAPGWSPENANPGHFQLYIMTGVLNLSSVITENMRPAYFNLTVKQVLWINISGTCFIRLTASLTFFMSVRAIKLCSAGQ